MRRLLLCFLGLVLFSTAPTTATVLIGPVTNPANGHSYYLLDQTSWTAARADALMLGGDLATVNDAAEDSWIYTTFEPFTAGAPGHGNSYWIGLNDAASEGTFVWVSGEPVTYTNWSPGEPSEGEGSGEDYTHVFGSTDPRATEWNDATNVGSGINAPFAVVEIVPVIPTVSVWGLVVMTGLLLTAAVIVLRKVGFGSLPIL